MADERAFDAIVVGLGPAGSSAARALAERGVRVLGLDRARFPRHKPCGGCLSAKIDRLLGDDLGPLVEREVHGVTLRFRDGEAIHARSDRPVAHLVSRLRFDAEFVRQAREAGAEIHEGEGVREVVPEADAVTVLTDQRQYRARVVVGADGANSSVARSVGLPHRGWRGVLIESEVDVGPDALRELGDEVILEFGTIPFGYGWIFPKADHLSIGVGGLVGRLRDPKACYRDFLARHRILEGIRKEKRYGCTLPVYSRRRPLSRGNVLLAGDAAGLVDPFIGEGIYYAVRSGRIAAEVIAEALGAGRVDLSRYDRVIDEEMGGEFRAAHRLAVLLYSFPDAFSRLAADAPEVLQSYFEVLRAERTHGEFLGEIGRKTVADLLTFASLLRPAPGGAREAYDRVAPHYDAYSRLWRSLAWHVELELGRLLSEVVPSDAVALDAGGGTGATAGLLLAEDRVKRVDLLDLSPGMIRVARKKLRDPRVRFVRGDMTRLPYPDRTFDLVVSTWAIETLQEPKDAAREFLRVIKDDGVVIYTFCSFPESGPARLAAQLTETLLGGKFAFRFLPRRERPYHSCARSRLVTFFGGLLTLVVLRKCCTVEDETAPCVLPASWNIA